MQSISFNIEGQKLIGTVFYPKKLKEKNPAIFFVPGWTSKKERSYQYAEGLSSLGYICILFDLRGHGQSEGDIKTFTIRDFLNDATAAYDYVSTVKGVDKENISAVGSSFGSYLIALLSEKRKLTNIALRVPANYPDTEFDESKFINSGSDNPQIVAWRKKVKKPNDTFALKAIHSFLGNILIIESEKDTIVPHQTIENYINSAPDKNKLTHIVLKNGPHTLKKGKFRDEVTKILVNWFKNKI